MATLAASSLMISTASAGAAIQGNVRAASAAHRNAQSKLASRASSLYVGNSGLVRSNPKQAKRVSASGIRCESSDGSGVSVDIWIGRVAMVSFAAAITSEIVTGKGVLASAGLGTPQPTLALALAALVGGITAFGVFRSTGGD